MLKHPAFFTLLTGLLLLVSCGPVRHAPKAVGNNARLGTGTTVLPLNAMLVPDGKLWASFYQQRSAEYKALCIQAYNIARLRIDQALAKPSSRPMAIVTDIDETFLDNSPYAVHQALQGKDYEAAGWSAWTALGAADTLAGAVSFFQYVSAKGIEVFYVTNREEQERAGTTSNLRRYGLPGVDDKHLILRNGPSSKEQRRQQIGEQYEIVLLLGDNLADFSSIFDKKTEQERLAGVTNVQQLFGDRFILLPNVTYGAWEESFYQYNYNHSAAEKDSLIRSALKGY